MGMLLLIVGLFWAGTGVLNVFFMSGPAEAIAGAFILNFLVFILPGLILAGFGSMLRNRKKDRRREERRA